MKRMSDEFIQDIFNTYGVSLQIDKAVEECAELIHALSKFKHGCGKYSDVIDELADMKIMLKQMTLLFGKEEIDKRMDYKVARLKKRLSEYDPSGIRDTIQERIVEGRSNGKKNGMMAL